MLAAADAALIAVSTLITYLARFEGRVPEVFAQWVPAYSLISIAVFLVAGALFGLYRQVLRHVGVDTVIRAFFAALSGTLLLAVGDVVASMTQGGLRPVPLGVIAIQGALVFISLTLARSAVRAFEHLRATQRREGVRILIIGAGSAGSLLLREIHARPDLVAVVVGFLDDNPQLLGRTMGGATVLGTIAEMESVVQRERVDQVFVALPSAPDAEIRRILNRAADIGVTTRIMPKIVIERGQVSLSDMREVDVEDLLGRELTPIDTAEVSATLAGKVVAVTGAAGSIGAELCRQVIAMRPAKLLALDLDESRLYELWFELEAQAPGVTEIRILDIRDARKVQQIFSQYQPNVVLHAAAYKHVPLMESEPSEAFRTNVAGTRTIMAAAADHGAERFVLISTDKAVAPSSVMGKTKQLAERSMLTMAQQHPQVVWTAVRFGNVLASRGSVVPIFRDMLRRGESLTVTDPHVTRYFMALPEAARLVLQAQAIGASGDILVLDMGEPVRIAELAQKMIALSGVPSEVVFTGLRPGEKLHEVLHTDLEELAPTERAKISRIANLDEKPLTDAEFEALASAAAHDQLSVQHIMEA